MSFGLFGASHFPLKLTLHKVSRRRSAIYSCDSLLEDRSMTTQGQPFASLEKFTLPAWSREISEPFARPCGDGGYSTLPTPSVLKVAIMP